MNHMHTYEVTYRDADGVTQTLTLRSKATKTGTLHALARERLGDDVEILRIRAT